MKWYGILAFIVLLGGLAGIVILGMNTDKTGSFFGDIGTFNCAKTWDKYRDIYYERWDPTLSINYMKNANLEVRIDMADQEILLDKHDCASTVNDWAHKSKYEEEIREIGYGQ